MVWENPSCVWRQSLNFKTRRDSSQSIHFGNQLQFEALTSSLNGHEDVDEVYMKRMGNFEDDGRLLLLVILFIVAHHHHHHHYYYYYNILSIIIIGTVDTSKSGVLHRAASRVLSRVASFYCRRRAAAMMAIHIILSSLMLCYHTCDGTTLSSLLYILTPSWYHDYGWYGWYVRLYKEREDIRLVQKNDLGDVWAARMRTIVTTIANHGFTSPPCVFFIFDQFVSFFDLTSGTQNQK